MIPCFLLYVVYIFLSFINSLLHEFQIPFSYLVTLSDKKTFLSLTIFFCMHFLIVVVIYLSLQTNVFHKTIVIDV